MTHDPATPKEDAPMRSTLLALASQGCSVIRKRPVRLLLALAVQGCSVIMPDPVKETDTAPADVDTDTDTDTDSDSDSDTDETGNTGDSADTGEDSGDTGDSAETGDTGETGDTAQPIDTAETGDTGEPIVTDADSDGHDDIAFGGDDCDDSDASVNPDAAEACDNVDNNCDGDVDEGVAWYQDDDGDGRGDATTEVIAECDWTPDATINGYVADATDCDDTRGDVSPDATEVCDEVDNDCDSEIDEGVQTTFYADNDQDGQGDAAATTEACELPEGYVENTTDCDDGNSAAYLGATEMCDGFDTDCDGLTDEADAADASTWYGDNDSDSFGDSATTQVACDQPSGYVADATDCDDGNVDVSPAADEACDGIDNNCDGWTDEDSAIDASTWYGDNDSDSFGDSATTQVACDQPSGYVADATDCDDGNSSVNPGASESCNSMDDDCDGTIDESDAVDASVWYADQDSDGYGGSSSVSSCSQPTGYVANNSDCNDLNSAVSPDATEMCDEIDNNCDGVTDEDSAADASTWYEDADSDTYGNPDSSTASCEEPEGFVANSEDCDDTDADSHSDIDGDGYTVCDGDCDDVDDEVYPEASEVNSLGYADGKDNDCDGEVDEGTDDVDDDGDGWSDLDGDCDDTDASVSPDESELCDGVDNNCDGTVDEGSSLDADIWYADQDSDSYGDASVSTMACDEPSGYVADATDCDDVSAASYPGGTETCDEADNDCDGEVDEDVETTFFADNDADSYGDANNTIDACAAPSGYVSDESDCDDGSSSVNPSATESCNSVDDDCDGTIDESDAVDASVWYADADEDSYGDASTTTMACDEPSGYVEDATDCDDNDDDNSPAGVEIVDGEDNDCDGNVDDGTDASDDDLDGYSEDEGDCDDGNIDVSPDAIELCDAVDNDCDGEVDESSADDASTWYVDLDSDGYGDANDSVMACDQPSGYVADSTDCDDGDAAYNPGADESDCTDPNDYNCDGSTEYEDNDADGFAACEECDDSNTDVNPDAEEVCDGVDNDCDGDADSDATDASAWYEDGDEDGYGDPNSSATSCEAPTGYVSDSSDCDDNDNDNNPDGIESCDDEDNDCDGSVDESGAVGESTWYADVDEDGFGDEDDSVTACDQADGYVADATDCNDTTELVNPAATEACDNSRDDDCDGSTDETTCAGTIGCVENGANMDVVLNGSITSGLMQALPSTPTFVGIVSWDTGASTTTAFLGDGFDHTLTVVREDFTPFATDGTDSQYFDLTDWSTTSALCSIEDNGDGTYVVQYNAP